MLNTSTNGLPRKGGIELAKKKNIFDNMVQPTSEGSIGKTAHKDLVRAVYVGPFGGITVPKIGLINIPRGMPVLVPPWFKKECMANENSNWEFPEDPPSLNTSLDDTKEGEK